MTDTHEAARLADALDDIAATSSCMYEAETTQAAALLRRIPELESRANGFECVYLEAMESLKATVAERDQLRAELEKVKAPEGFELVAVKGFYDLVFWLERCASKGHLENCYDLIAPWEAFDYRAIEVATQPPATQGSEA